MRAKGYRPTKKEDNSARGAVPHRLTRNGEKSAGGIISTSTRTKTAESTKLRRAGGRLEGGEENEDRDTGQ